MRKNEYICNRCEREIGPEYGCTNHNLRFTSARIVLWGVGEHRSMSGEQIDLCPECYNEFISFLGGERNAE